MGPSRPFQETVAARALSDNRFVREFLIEALRSAAKADYAGCCSALKIWLKVLRIAKTSSKDGTPAT